MEYCTFLFAVSEKMLYEKINQHTELITASKDFRRFKSFSREQPLLTGNKAFKTLPRLLERHLVHE